mmetsp:Transcript_23659/g.39447  ORF Transcript_23659/g.39447 Transcript_23659/m.39447 type:complete len:577 (+) Transcript_23659:133-1863(+)
MNSIQQHRYQQFEVKLLDGCGRGDDKTCNRAGLSPATIRNPTVSFQVQQSKRTLDQIIPEDMLLYNILPFLANRSCLNNLSQVNHKFRRMLFSNKTSSLWDKSSPRCFEVCIDGYCPVCHFRHVRGSVDSAVNFLSLCPVKRVQIHCFVADIPACLCALSRMGHLEELNLTLTNQHDSPSLEALLSEERMSSCLASGTGAGIVITTPPTTTTTTIGGGEVAVVAGAAAAVMHGLRGLKRLTLDSSHLHHVNRAGRSRLLDYLGQNLEYLSFKNLSTSCVFTLIDSRCPKLRYIRMDQAKANAGLETYKNPYLEALDLRRCNFIPVRKLAHLPALRRFRFSSSFRMEEAQLKLLICIIPKSVVDLSIEVPSALANLALIVISKKHHQLQSLTLDGSHEKGLISSRVLAAVGTSCPQLKCLRIRHAKSVDALGFEDDSAYSVCQRFFPRLSHMYVRYNPTHMQALHDYIHAMGRQAHAVSSRTAVDTRSRNTIAVATGTAVSSTGTTASIYQAVQEQLASPQMLPQGPQSELEIVLWEWRRWLPAGAWEEMQAKVEALSSMSNSVQVSLRDVDWTAAQ